jgi:hypothetical protein
MEKQFLIDDLKIGESWRLFKIMGEFVEGVEALHNIGPAVSIFGSARIKPTDPIYKQAEEIARGPLCTKQFCRYHRWRRRRHGGRQ